jgi:hypothetical protein
MFVTDDFNCPRWLKNHVKDLVKLRGFAKDITTRDTVFKDMENPFTEDSTDVLTLGTQFIMSPEVKTEFLGKRKYHQARHNTGFKSEYSLESYTRQWYGDDEYFCIALNPVMLSNWKTFLHVDINKTGLFKDLAKEVVSTPIPRCKVIVSTHEENVVLSCSLHLSELQPCSHEKVTRG